MKGTTVLCQELLLCGANWKMEMTSFLHSHCGPAAFFKRSLSHRVHHVLLWRGQSIHSLRRPWSAGMPVPPLHHSMAPGVLAFIHVINSVKPCLKATHASLCPQAQSWPALPRCGKQSYVTSVAYFHSHPLPCLIFRWGGRRHYFHIDTHWNTVFYHSFLFFPHFQHEWALIQMSVNRLTDNRGHCDKTKQSTEQGGVDKKQPEQLKGIHWVSRGIVFTVWLALCSVFRQGLLSKVWNIL